MKKIILFFTLVTSTIFAQAPANDACSGAINLGTLGTANGACPGSGVVLGAATTAVGTSANATTENPYNTVINCEAGTADMASPAIDVWYTFTSASGSANSLSVTITNFPGVHFAVYEAPNGNCTGLVPRGCALDGGLIVEPIQPSTVFYLQVSGNTSTLTDPSFNISLQNNFNCDNCFTAGEITATPLPVNGAYNPGQTVNFCFHVDKYTEVSVNWLHGVQLSLGSGWNAASVVATAATPWGTPAQGTWNYYPAGIVSNNNGATRPMGWYFNRTSGLIGGTGTAGDTNPGNNYGDEFAAAGVAPANVWNFCFNVTTANVCSPGSDLSVTFNTSGDGESGFYGSLACTTDPPIKFLAQGACCPPTMASTSLTCFGNASGSATATPVGSGAPFTYNWTGPAGYTNTSSGAGATIISGLAAGVYTLSTKDINLCERITTVTVTQPTSVTAVPSSTNASCVALGSASVVAGGGVAGYTYSWTPSGGTGASAAGLSAGIYTVTVKDSKLCPRTATVNITSTGTVTSGFAIPSATQCLTGNSFSFNNTGTAAAVHQYSFSPAAGAPAVSTQTNYVGAVFTAAGTYTVTHTVTNGVCVNTTTQVVTVNPNPLFNVTPTNPVCTLPNGQILINNTSTGGQVVGFTSSLGTVTGQTVSILSGGTTPIITATNQFACTFTLSQAMVNQPGPTGFALTSTITGCAGPTGAIAFNTPVGGTPGYTYSYNNGAFTATSPIIGLAAGNQTVTIRDNNGCTFTKTITVGTAPSPTLIAGSTSPAACGAANGSYTLTGISGGTPTYSYHINGGALTTNSVVGSLIAGPHPVDVIDANGCTFNTTFNVGSSSGVNGMTVSAVQPSCGLNNGTATVTTVTGGTPTYSYSFDGGGYTTTNNVIGLAAGNHTYTVKDANGCLLPVTFSLTNPGTPTAIIANTNSVTCNASATGAFTVNASGGTVGYTYSITPTGSSNVTGLFSGLTAQTYTVKVFDGAGCTYTLTNTINQPTPITLTLTPQAVSCNGGSNGTVTAVAGGGTPAYSYTIDGVTVQSGGVFTGLTSGAHSVIVRDLNNCPLTVTTTVTQPTALALTFTANPTACVGATGTATIGVTGGTPAYSYSVDGSTSSSLPGSLAFGSHTINVVDNKGCPISTTFNTPMVTGPASASVVASNATCGSANATATVVSVTGGGGTNTYNFDNAGFNVSNTVGSLAAGTHTVIIKDVNQCIVPVTYNVNNTGSPTANITSTTNVSCFGGSNGSIVVGASGGTPGYSYTLTPGNITNTTGSFTGLTAQSYNIIVKDNVGCATSATATLTEPTAVTLSLTPTNLLCNGVSTGSIVANGANGTGTLNYSINGGGFSAPSSFINLAAGNYTIAVRDVNSCSVIATTTLTQPTVLTNTITTTPNSCNGTVGSATFATSGAVPAYSYSVDGVAVANNTPSGLTSAPHTGTVKDANGCSVTTPFTIGNVTGPTVMTFTTTNSTCGNANGTSTVTSVTGGTVTYQYSFDGGTFGPGNTTTALVAGQHTVTVLDGNSCVLTSTYNVLNTGSPAVSITGSLPVLCNGGATGSFTASGSGGSGAPFTYSITSVAGSNLTGAFGGLPIGIYTVIAKDKVGCAISTTVEITEPTAVSVSATSLPAKCNGTPTGTITAVGAGGVGTYSYSLNGAAFQSSGVYPNQGMGTYNISVKDANGCSSTTTVSVTEPTIVGITIDTQNANCSAPNGSATVTAVGGMGGYTYSWSPGGSAPIKTGLSAGNYTVTVTDANNCSISGLAVVGLTPGGTAVITASTPISCFGGCDGSLTASMPTGVAPITYVWNDVSGQIVPTAVGLCAGTYSCSITDFYGCKATVGATLANPTILTATISALPVKCFGTSTGTILAGATGGTGAYNYLWTSNGFTTATVANVVAQTHTIVITDAKNCSVTRTVIVTEPTDISLTSTVVASNCNQLDGSACVTAIGGTPTYSYSWAGGQTTSCVNAQAAGTYTINVIDANGCLKTLAATIPNISGPSISVTNVIDVACFGGATGSATTSISGGTGPFLYQWSGSANNQVSPIASNLPMGVHTVTMTDQATGCKASASVTINQPTQLTVNVTATQPKCFGATNGSGFAVANGGTPMYTYTWTTPGASNGTTSDQAGQGNYNVTVKDAKGCIAIGSMTLTNPPMMISSVTQTNVSCFGLCDGQAVASVTNAVLPVNYTWIGGASPVFSQLLSTGCAGTYTMIATDFNNCTASTLINITQPNQLTANITSSGSVTCNGGNDGYAGVTPGGGTTPYVIDWQPFGGSGTTATSLTAQSYTATVTDAHNCVASANVTILEPAPLNASLGTGNPKCFSECNGTGTVTTSGGAGAISFLWYPGLEVGNFANTLCAGNHSVEITYNNVCKTIKTFTLTQPQQLIAIPNPTNSTCGNNNGHVLANVSGGTIPYQGFQWSNGPTTVTNYSVYAGAYSFTVTDANNCKAYTSGLVNDVSGPVVAVVTQTNVKCYGENNGSAYATIAGGTPTYSISWDNGNPLSATTQTVTGLPAGLYNISVKDALGCVGSSSVLITQPPILNSAITQYSNVTCFGLSDGSATIIHNGGGTPNYQCVWTPAVANNTVFAVTGLSAGTYTATITDQQGCTTSKQISIFQPSPLVITNVSITPIPCFGQTGSIDIDATGGNAPYSYTWTPTLSNSDFVTNLAQGGYSVYIADTKGCNTQTIVSIQQPPPLIANISSSIATCGNANGAATITANGGTQITPANPYSYNWSTTPISTNTVVTGLAPGIVFNCIVTDGNGCNLTQTLTIQSSATPTITSLTSTPPTCAGYLDGTITINYAGGTPNYIVTWATPIVNPIPFGTPALTQSVTGIGAGIYSATLKDVYGCTTNSVVAINAPLPLLINPSANLTICYGQGTDVYAPASGGTQPPVYSYTWTASNGIPLGNNTAGPYHVTPTVTTTYTVQLTNQNNCLAVPKVITVNVTPSLSAVASTTTICDKDAATLIPGVVSPGNGGPYQYTWTPGVSTTSLASVTGTAASSPQYYSVIVGDGCSIPATAVVFTVNVNPLPNGVISASTPTICAPDNVTFSLTPTVPGSYSFDWDLANKTTYFGTNNPQDYPFTSAGIYTVGVSIVDNITRCSNYVYAPGILTAYATPIASFTPTPKEASIIDPTISFINNSTGGNAYFWEFGDPVATDGTNNSFGFNTTHTYSYTGTYNVYLQVTNSNGCKAVTMVPIEITPDFVVFIPNAFTPCGGDVGCNGINDTFFPKGVGINEDNYRMDIFDRWGENIFTSNAFRKGWDGSVKGSSKIAEQGVYVYKIMVYDLQGNKHPYVGHVTLLKSDQ